jgi:glycosyltransferase involved in cell wall biosynthesis
VISSPFGAVSLWYEDKVTENQSNVPSLSLVIPAYNEALRIQQTLDTAWSYLHQQPYESEIVLVDDGSLDATAALAHDFASSHPGTRVLTIPHGGKAAAVRAGMLASHGDLVAFSDADLATPITYLEPFRAAALNGADVVIGSREGSGAQRLGEPVYRHLMGRVFNLFVRATVLPSIQDTQCGFKLFRRQAAQRILSRARLYASPDDPVHGPRVTAFDVELLVIARRLGYRIETIPVVWTYGSMSKVNPVSDTLTNIRDVLRVKWNDLRGRYQ